MRARRNPVAVARKLDELSEEWYTLDIMKRDGKLQSADNRRLLCVEAWQSQEPSSYVRARVRLRDWDPLFDQYLKQATKITSDP